MESVAGLSVFNAKEASEFYAEVFDATIEQLIYMKEAPGQEDSPYKDLVMHGRLKIGDSIFYIHDQLDNNIQAVGRNVQFNLSVFTEEEFMTIYHRLVGKVTFEREITVEYWKAKSFSIKDPYDIIWHIYYIMPLEDNEKGQ